MKRWVKTIGRKAIVRTLGFATRRVDRNYVRIFTYHSVQNHSNVKAHMPPARFEEHIRYLAENGYCTLRIADIARQWPRIFYDQPAVSLTFDDGLYNNWMNVCEILTKYNMTGTFFIPTAYIGDNKQMPLSEEMKPYQSSTMLSWSDIHNMVWAGFEIGAHSHTHVMVAKQPLDRARKEIFTPKKILENRLGIEIKSFAYPKGHSDSFADWTKELLKEAGYQAGCTQLGGTISQRCDLLSLPRNGMTGLDTLEEFKLKLAGNYDCLRWFRLRP